MQPTMLISLPDGYHLYGCVNTGLARLILDGGCDCAFLIPPESEGCVPPELRARAEWLAFPRYRLSPAGRFLNYLRMEASRPLRNTFSWKLMRRRYNRTLKHKLLRPVGYALGAMPFLRAAFFAAERWLAPSPLRKAGPWRQCRTAVFGSAGVKDLDLALLQVIRRLPARTYGIVYSWDNITSKMSRLARFDRIAVWNHVMKDDAVRFLGYRPEQVAVVGAPQFDIYHDFAPRRSRQEFLKSMGMPPEARYVLYTGVPRRISPWGPEYVRTLADGVGDRHVLVRGHPQEPPDTYRDVEGLPRVRVCYAGRNPDAAQRVIGFWQPGEQEAITLAEQLYFADAVVNVASTVTLEALRLDRPVVNIAYDGQGEAFPVAMADYYRIEHYAPVASSGAVVIARSAEELVVAVRSVDQWWPGLDTQRRQLNRLVDPFQDGQAAARLARDIIDFHRGGPAAQEKPQ